MSYGRCASLIIVQNIHTFCTRHEHRAGCNARTNQSIRLASSYTSLDARHRRGCAFPVVVVTGCASFATLPNVSKVLIHWLVVLHVGSERVKITPPMRSSIGGNAAVLLDLFHLLPQLQLRPLLKSVTPSPHSAVKLRLYETS